LKRRRTAALDKGKQVQVQDVAPSRGIPPADEGLFQLPKVWSQSDRFSPQASLYLGDSELKAIRDLGTAGRTRAVTEGVVGAMRPWRSPSFSTTHPWRKLFEQMLLLASGR
jgi:hypothetical protein